MINILLQLLIASIWTAHLLSHTRRLLRLAHVEQLRRWEGVRLRSGLNRIWWWLGQEEFWQQVQIDSIACIQLTIMLFLMVWSMGL